VNVRKSLFSVLVAVALAGGLAYVFRAPLSVALVKRVAADRLAADALGGLPDGLHVGLCGAGSPFPDDKRAGPCTLVVAGSRLFVFDAGNASTRNIGRMGFDHGRIEAIFLTHFHSDHIDGLGELMLQRWVAGANAEPVPVLGPAGVEKVVAGIMQAYAQDQGYRVADLLVHEALSAPLVGILNEAAVRAGRANLQKIFADIVDYHTSPEQAAEVARDAGVRYLLLNHIAPPLPLPGLEKAFLGGAPDVYRGPIRVGSDGDFVSLPAGTTEVKASRRF
jgi:ribonuclease BN (tRNA processing enzyme)